MRKLIIRIFNLIYIAGCVVAILGFLIKPLVSLNVSLSVPVSEIVSLIKKEDKKEPATNITKSSLIRRDGENEQDTSSEGKKEESSYNIWNIITVENLEKEGIKNLDLAFEVSISPKNIGTYFDLENNYKIIHDGIFDSIDTVLDSTFVYAKKLIKVIGKLVATDTVKQKVIEEFTDSLKESSEEAEALFNKYNCDDKVEEIVDNVLELFEEGNTPVSVLSEAIMGEKNEEGEYSSGVKGILESIKDQPEFEGKITEKTIDELEPSVIEEAINKAIEAMPEIAVKQPVLGDDGKPALDDDGNPLTEYVIKDLNAALIALLEKIPSMTGEKTNQDNEHQSQPTEQQEEISTEETDVTKRITRNGEIFEENVSDEELRDKLETFLLDKIPFDLDGFDYSFNGITSYVLLGLIVLAIFPWFLFLLITLIRTIRKEKCWTKPWVVFVFAFLQLTFGIGLTISLHYAPAIISSVLKNEVTSFAWVFSGLNLTFKSAALWASIVYLAMIPFTIAYMIVCHETKVNYKQAKIEAKAAKKAA